MIINNPFGTKHYELGHIGCPKHSKLPKVAQCHYTNFDLLGACCMLKELVYAQGRYWSCSIQACANAMLS